MKLSIAAHEALPAVGLHGLALAGCHPRHWCSAGVEYEAFLLSASTPCCVIGA